MRRSSVVVIISVAAGLVAAGYWISHALSAMATLEPGMTTLHLPSGATVYLRRQAYFDKPAEVYISANGDFCAPYDRWYDYKLPHQVQGGSESPVLISYVGNTVVVHSPKPLQRPWLTRSTSFSVALQELTPEQYSAYIGTARPSAGLPTGWVKVEIPFGHNTCAL